MLDNLFSLLLWCVKAHVVPPSNQVRAVEQIFNLIFVSMEWPTVARCCQSVPRAKVPKERERVVSGAFNPQFEQR